MIGSKSRFKPQTLSNLAGRSVERTVPLGRKYFFAKVSRFTQSQHLNGLASLMRFKPVFSHCCQVVGRTSAIIAFAGMGSFALAATAVDVWR
jgi:hypothetical protein